MTHPQNNLKGEMCLCCLSAGQEELDVSPAAPPQINMFSFFVSFSPGD